MSRRIEVYADWFGEEPVLIGTLVADQARGKEHFSFAYATDWLAREDALYLLIDPELLLFQGTQHTHVTSGPFWTPVRIAGAGY